MSWLSSSQLQSHHGHSLSTAAAAVSDGGDTMGTGVIQRGEQRKSVVSEVEDATKGSLLQQSKEKSRA